MGAKIVWRIGAKSDDRRAFWRSAWHPLRKSQIDAIYNMGFVCHIVIQFMQEALRGERNA